MVQTEYVFNKFQHSAR